MIISNPVARIGEEIATNYLKKIVIITSMEFIDILKTRRAIRKYSDKDVSEELVKEIIELANSSPSAGNVQARAVVIVKDQAVIEKIRAVSRGLSRFEGKVSFILVILSKPRESEERYEERGKNLYALQDATIFASYIQLIATDRGLSTCWVGSFNESDVEEILDLPEEVKPVAMIPLGYALETAEMKERKSLNEIILKEV
jgi:nitroreductase